ncbi:MAG: peptidoglycan DD-metalloendopeptidase family protein, partial [Rhodospirillaceae bacterium]|nr:peptidoglycan DD-metalloendopeptidase family protein [Rhodospirillaceae bacterium]
MTGVGWFSHITVVYFGFHTILAGKDREIAKVSNNNSVLSLRVTAMRNDISDVSGTLKRSHHHLVGLLAQNDQLRVEIDNIKEQLTGSESKRAAQVKRQQDLMQQLARLEGNLEDSEKQSSTVTQTLDQTKSKLTATMIERSELAATRDGLNQQVKAMEERIALLRDSHQTALIKVTRRTVHDIRKIEGIISKSGLNVRSLLKRINPEAYAVGGPFVPAAGNGSILDEGQTALDRHLAHWEDLQRLMKNLPLVAPLDHYKLGSPYGRRKDPINNKWAIHKGVDLSAKNRTTIFATAGGKVVYRGWKGRYGRLVEIDHGFGIRTRYGHMRRISVRRGQTVAVGQKIGQVGTSGRSTGPHVHYEIIVNGKQINPLKFIEAGK